MIRILGNLRFSGIIITHPAGLMVRDARRCRAPHHEGLEDLILRSTLSRVSKDEATGPKKRSVRNQPALVGGNLAGTRDILLDELVERLAVQEGIGAPAHFAV